MLTLHYITACVLCIIVHSSPPGYSKSILNDVKHYIERSNFDDLNALKDQTDAQNEHSNMSKKALWNFSYQMIAIFGPSMASSLADYGCYCGVGGGGTPVDGLDRCCKVHDECYGYQAGCYPKWTAYQYKIINGRTVYCKDSYWSCKYRVCRCDKLFVDCIYRNKNAYNPANYNIC